MENIMMQPEDFAYVIVFPSSDLSKDKYYSKYGWTTEYKDANLFESRDAAQQEAEKGTLVIGVPNPTYDPDFILPQLNSIPNETFDLGSTLTPKQIHDIKQNEAICLSCNSTPNQTTDTSKSNTGTAITGYSTPMMPYAIVDYPLPINPFSTLQETILSTEEEYRSSQTDG